MSFDMISVSEEEMKSVAETVASEVWEYLCEAQDHSSIAIEADNYVGICTRNGSEISISVSQQEFTQIRNRYSKGIEEELAQEVYESMPLEDAVDFRTVVKGIDFHTIIYIDDEGDLATLTWSTPPIKVHHCIPSYFQA